MWSDYPDILTPKDACSMLRVSRHTVYKLIADNELKAKKISRHYRIKKSDLLDYLNKI